MARRRPTTATSAEPASIRRLRLKARWRHRPTRADTGHECVPVEPAVPGMRRAANGPRPLLRALRLRPRRRRGSRVGRCCADRLGGRGYARPGLLRARRSRGVGLPRCRSRADDRTRRRAQSASAASARPARTSPEIALGDPAVSRLHATLVHAARRLVGDRRRGFEQRDDAQRRALTRSRRISRSRCATATGSMSARGRRSRSRLRSRAA